MNASVPDGGDCGDCGDEEIEARMGSHLEQIMTAARQAAAQLRDEIAVAADQRAAQVETAAARRAHAILTAAEAEAEQVVSAARASAEQYLTASRRRVDEFAAERHERITGLGEDLAEQAAALIQRLGAADKLARQLDDLHEALGAAAARIVAEAAREDLVLPAPAPGRRSRAGHAAAPDARAVPAAPGSPSLEARLARATYNAREAGWPARPLAVRVGEGARDEV